MLPTLVLRTQSDDRLVELVADGSEPAFEIIVQRYRRDLLSYCSRLLVADGRAEDAVQQALLAAWSALRAGREVRQLRPWLYRITHNQAMSALRRPGWSFAELSEQISASSADDGDLERRMLMRETLAAVAALSDTQREAILRTAIEGESYAEAARAMGLSDTAVRGLVQRARVNLRAAVAAFTPAPLVLWAAGATRRHSSALALLSDTAGSSGAAATVGATGGGAGAGAVGVAVKSAAILASSAAVVGGGIAARPSLVAVHSHHRPTTPIVSAATHGRATRRARVPTSQGDGRPFAMTMAHPPTQPDGSAPDAWHGQLAGGRAEDASLSLTSSQAGPAPVQREDVTASGRGSLTPRDRGPSRSGGSSGERGDLSTPGSDPEGRVETDPQRPASVAATGHHGRDQRDAASASPSGGATTTSPSAALSAQDTSSGQTATVATVPGTDSGGGREQGASAAVDPATGPADSAASGGGAVAAAGA